MTLVLYEWRKLLRLPALWAFLALCLVFNGSLIASESYGRGLFNEISAITAELGQRVDDDFQAGLAAGSPSGVRDALAEVTAGMENIYETYDLSDLSAFYQETVEKSPLAVKWMVWKYRLLEDRLDHLAQSGAAMDLYAGPLDNLTHDSFQFLFGSLMRAILTESSLLGMLAVLYLLGHEDICRTTQQVYASRTGRRLCRVKVLAGLAAALVLYALLVLLTLAPYFALWNYSGIWSASVSSQFNYLTDMLYRRPFFTWADFTVVQYLIAALALGGALTAVFCLLAAVCGVLVRNAYLAALALMLLCLAPLTALCACGAVKWWPAYFALCFQPVSLWLCAGGWFTELGLSAVLPWQETVTTAVNLILLGSGTALALKRFSRKDVV